jgi:hypothetical protein
MTGGSIAEGLFWGSALAVANFIFAVVVARFALGRTDEHDFLGIAFGSMLIRMLLLLSAIWFGLKVANFHKTSFTVTVLAEYAIFLIVEIIIVYRGYTKKRARHSEATRIKAT